jgi:hypothetical protein
MTLIKNKKRCLSIARLVLISLSIMAMFSIFLHDHEFDHLSTDEDCVPCQWTQISIDVDPEVPSIDYIPVSFSKHIEIGIFHYKNLKHSYFGLSPPSFS